MELTRWLRGFEEAGPDDQEAAIGVLYHEIRRLARSFMRGERGNHTLAPTALANEAYLRLFGTEMPAFDSSAEFLTAAAVTLRRILVEHGRRRGRQKRGGGMVRHDAEDLGGPTPDERLVDLDEALEQLARFDATKARLVELRFFAGLTLPAAAKLLGMSERTAAREWRVTRAFLRSHLQDRDASR